MTTELKNRTEADAIADIMTASVSRTVSPNLVDDALGGPGILVFQDKTIKNLEILKERPNRKRAQVTLTETASFVGYLNDFDTGTTNIFAAVNERGGRIVAILDYHADNDGKPGWGEHVCTLNLTTTPEWQKWVGSDGKAFSQEAFAEFLQDNMPDIVAPDAASLIDMAQMLIGTKSVSFKSGKNLKNGSVHLDYVETIDVRGVQNQSNNAMDIPDGFTLGIVPFIGGNGVELKGRLRYRITDQKLSFHYVLDRPHKLIEAAVKLAIQEIHDGTKNNLPVLLGSASISPPPSL